MNKEQQNNIIKAERKILKPGCSVQVGGNVFHWDENGIIPEIPLLPNVYKNEDAVEFVHLETKDTAVTFVTVNGNPYALTQQKPLNRDLSYKEYSLKDVEYLNLICMNSSVFIVYKSNEAKYKGWGVFSIGFDYTDGDVARDVALDEVHSEADTDSRAGTEYIKVFELKGHLIAEDSNGKYYVWVEGWQHFKATIEPTECLNKARYFAFGKKILDSQQNEIIDFSDYLTKDIREFSQFERIGKDIFYLRDIEDNDFFYAADSTATEDFGKVYNCGRSQGYDLKRVIAVNEYMILAEFKIVWDLREPEQRKLVFLNLSTGAKPIIKYVLREYEILESGSVVRLDGECDVRLDDIEETTNQVTDKPEDSTADGRGAEKESLISRILTAILKIN